MSTDNRTGVDSLTAVALAAPDRVAVIDDRPGAPARTLTYHQLNRCVNRMANGLRDVGVQPGDKTMWLGQNSIEVVAFSHAARKVGAVSVPLNYRLADDEFDFVINNSDSVLIYADVAYADMLQRLHVRTPKLTHTVIFAGPGPTDPDGRPVGMHPGQTAEVDFLGDDHEPPPSPAPSKVMIYTSGTTGNPKGAVRNPSAGGSQVAGLVGLLGYRPDDIHVTCGPLYHSGPAAFANLAFLMGRTVVVQHKFDPEDWLRLIDAYRCSSTFSAPTPIRLVLRLDDETKGRYDVSCMRVMIANAAPWPFALKEAYVGYFPPESLWEIYGSTELGVNTVLAPGDQLRKPGSCGKPAPEVDIALFDDDRRRVTEPNVPGEVFIKASSVFDTYYKAEDRYDADEFDGWHTVGDVAYFDEEGFYYICDRKRDMIITGGMNVYPAEVEAALERHHKVFEVAVIGVPSDEWGERVLAVVVPHEPEPGQPALTVEELHEFAHSHLAGYKAPSEYRFVDEIPKTGSNKILKRELRERFANPVA